MVGRVEGVASRYLGCGRLFEATHALEEAVDLVRSLAQRRGSSPPVADLTRLDNLQRLQMHCLKKLGRASEGHRLLSRKPNHSSS